MDGRGRCRTRLEKLTVFELKLKCNIKYFGAKLRGNR